MILNFNLDADVAQRVGLVNESGMRELANDLHMCRTAVVDVNLLLRKTKSCLVSAYASDMQADAG